MKSASPMSAWQFTIFRMLFGSYLFLHFAQLLPWANEVFGRGGMLPDPAVNPLHGLFPNVLVMVEWPVWPAVVVGLLALAAVAFACGFHRRTAALLLWYGWACLFHRNNLTANPGLPYVGLLLALCALVPPGEPLSPRGGAGRAPWRMPAAIYWCPWVLLALGYTYSGVWKLFSPSWVDGAALLHLLENPLARPGPIREWLRHCPPMFLQGLTWLALAGEILFLPLCCSRAGRRLAWLAMVGMHVGILLVVDFADLTLGMLMVHAFTFDPRWLPGRPRAGVLFFDGDCGLCHRWVRFAAAGRGAADLAAAPLGGATARAMFPRLGLPPDFQDGLVWVEGSPGAERAWIGSSAVLRILDARGGGWRLVSWLRFIPGPVREMCYRLMARHRHRWWRGDAACALPQACALRMLP